MQTGISFTFQEKGQVCARLKDINSCYDHNDHSVLWWKSNKLRIRKPDLIAATSQWHIPSHSLLACRPIASAVGWALS